MSTEFIMRVYEPDRRHGSRLFHTMGAATEKAQSLSLHSCLRCYCHFYTKTNIQGNEVYWSRAYSSTQQTVIDIMFLYWEGKYEKLWESPVKAPLAPSERAWPPAENFNIWL